MAEVIRMPRLSDTMEEGNIVSWLKSVGDEVEPGDILAEVETDKATMELESFNSGVLLHIGVKEGPVPVEGVIAIIGDKGEDISGLLKDIENETKSNGKEKEVEKEEKKEEEEKDKSSSEKKEKPAESKADEEDKDSKTEKKPEKSDTGSAATPEPATSKEASTTEEGRIKASPLARKMAEESGIDISRIKGTGESGRIVKRDIDKAVEHGVPAASGPTALSFPGGLDESIYGEKPVSQMRKVIARRLGESKFTSPHFYLTIEVDMVNAMQAREALNKESEVRISYNDIIVKASAAALRKHPKVNASWGGDTITYHKEINIGVAVAVEEGLLVPVIRNADLKSLTMIKNEIKALAAKARDRKLQPEEMSGNTFTISNLGMFDIDEFTAIINPPDACIIAVGSIVEKPVVKNEQIEIGHTMKITMSCDHRIVDGATGAAFLQTLKANLENPVMIIL